MILQWIIDHMVRRGVNDDVARHAEGAAQNVELEAERLHEESVRDPLEALIEGLRRQGNSSVRYDR